MPDYLSRDYVQKHLPVRPADAHKGRMGSLAVLAGSRRYRGAALLAIESAMRSGVGLVRLLGIEAICVAAATRLPGCILEPLAETYDGGIHSRELQPIISTPATALLAGCGMGNTRDTADLILGLLADGDCPMVLDADALNVLAGQLDTGSDALLRDAALEVLACCGQPVILTPHVGEMARLAGLDAASVSVDMENTASRFSAQYSCVVVLKSHRTVIAGPDGSLLINDEAGNSGMAKGGSGDVLAGIIASLLCQGMAPVEAAACGVWVHARAGDICAQKLSRAGMLPQDMPRYLCDVWNDLGA